MINNNTVLKSMPWVFIGRLIGVIFIIPIGYFMLNHFYYGGIKYNNKLEVAKVYQRYIDNSEALKLTLPSYNSDLYSIDEISFKIRTGTDMMTDYIYAQTMSFYSMEYKKFFILMFFGYNVELYDWRGKEVILTVNKDDMQNQNYGTKGNPIPVLKQIGVNESLRPDNKDYDTTYMDEFYKNNVIGYLRYCMNKDEFNVRFKNK